MAVTSTWRHALGRRPTRKWPGRRAARLDLELLETREVLSAFFPADNPWNQVIANAPVAANSATLVQTIGPARSLHPDFGTSLGGSYWGIPYAVVSGSTPRQTVVLDAYPGESDRVDVPFPIWATDPARGLVEGDPAPGDGDRHVLIYDQDNHVLYELFNARRPNETGDGRWHADAEAVWYTDQNYFRPSGWTSADAAGLPILPGLVRYEEVQAGVIDHALRFTAPVTRAGTWAFPASHYASRDPSAGLPRMGERFRLRADFDISGFSPQNQVILQALKTYGMILADNGGSWFLSGAPDPRWNDADIDFLKRIHGSDFEAVDLTPRVTNLTVTSGPTAGGTQLTINGLNFGGGAGLTQVWFGDVRATSFQILSDTQVRVMAPAHAAGTVDVRVSSGYGTSAVVAGDRFTFTATSDRPPVLSAIADRTIPSTQGSLSVALSATDPDGDPLTLSASAQSLAYVLDQQLGLYSDGNLYTNWGGRQEKWVQGGGSQWYFILPNGELYRWNGGAGAAGTLIGTPGTSYWVDPSLLYNAQPDPHATLGVSGSTLSITRQGGFIGAFVVTVTASDGLLSASQSFTVTVTTSDRPPVLSAIADRTVPPTQTTLTVPLSATDPDGQPLTFSAVAQSLAYVLDQQLGLFSDGNLYTNWGGRNEKWVQGGGGLWYFLLPNGQLFRWDGGGGATGTLVGNVGASYYATPSLLYDAVPDPHATLGVSGSTLTVTRQGGFVGSLVITVTVSDGQLTDSKTFTVTVA